MLETLPTRQDRFVYGQRLDEQPCRKRQHLVGTATNNNTLCTPRTFFDNLQGMKHDNLRPSRSQYRTVCDTRTL